MRVLGIFKVGTVLAAIFAVIFCLSNDLCFTAVVVSFITLYVVFGGYLSLLREGAVRATKLPMNSRSRMEVAKDQLTNTVKSVSGIRLDGLKLYLVPDSDMNATAYGCNCVSVTRGTLENTDLLTMEAVLAHEVSHTLSYDPEFNRAVFCFVTLLVLLLSIVSFAATVIVFLIFLIFSGFRSWLSVIAFQGTNKAVGGLFGLLQRGIVVLYRTVLGIVSRSAEYRCDHYACALGYGVQLQYFLQITESDQPHQMTLTEVLYRSHPPTVRRLERLEQQIQDRRVTGTHRKEVGAFEKKKLFTN